MLVIGKMKEIASELKRYKIDIAALQEIRWGGKGRIDEKEFTVIYSGAEEQGWRGVGFILSKTMRSKIIGMELINERMAYIRLEGKPTNISIVNIYAPTETNTDEEKEHFYEELEEMLEVIPREDLVIVLGDCNARIGKESIISQVAGKHTIHEKTNDNGIRLCGLAAKMNLIISSTKFEHPIEHKVTWISPDKKTQAQIDHVLVGRRRQSSVMDVRTYRGACADSDHFMVTATIRLKQCRVMERNVPKKKWNIERLKDVEVRRQYMEELEKKLKSKPKHGSIEESWTDIKEAINEAAGKIIGNERRNRNRVWFDEKCKKAHEEKVKARIIWLRNNRDEDEEEYKEKRKECNKTIRDSKRKWIEEGLQEIEKESKKSNTRKFYQKINKQNKVYKPRMAGIKNKQDKVIEQEDEYKEVWVEYFKELLNTNQRQEELELEDEPTEVLVEEPTLQEVKEILSNSRNAKAPGKDGINMELIKHGGDVIMEYIFMLIKKIWKEEKLPADFEVGQIILIHKKGSQQECKNYRGITLLNTTYKILSTLIQRRLQEKARNIIGQYQNGFVKGKSTTDAVYILKQIMEKVQEYKINVEMLFVDFEQAFDSIDRGKLMLVLKELGIPAKLRKLIKMTLETTRISIKTQKGETTEFTINKGVKQGDALSATLFNMSIEYITRKINKGTLRTRGGQLLAYADDLVLMAKRRDILTNMVDELITEGQKVGLRINKDKTKIMRIGNKDTAERIKISNQEYQEVDRFKYLGVMISNDGDREPEIRDKIISTNRAFYANKKLLKSKFISKKTKIRIYNTLIKPIAMYGAEVMSMTRKDEERLRIMERKILRAILGPIKVTENEYRTRMNHELAQEMETDIVRKIKQQRVKWLGHVMRADHQETTNIIMNWIPAGKKKKGRPRSRWLDEVQQDLLNIGIRMEEVKEKVKDRKMWNKISLQIQ